jgi:hypothetical protein
MSHRRWVNLEKRNELNNHCVHSPEKRAEKRFRDLLLFTVGINTAQRISDLLRLPCNYGRRCPTKSEAVL